MCIHRTEKHAQMHRNKTRGPHLAYIGLSFRTINGNPRYQRQPMR
jgi:hypothetical protein